MKENSLIRNIEMLTIRLSFASCLRSSFEDGTPRPPRVIRLLLELSSLCVPSKKVVDDSSSALFTRIGRVEETVPQDMHTSSPNPSESSKAVDPHVTHSDSPDETAGMSDPSSGWTAWSSPRKAGSMASRFR